MKTLLLSILTLVFTNIATAASFGEGKNAKEALNTIFDMSTAEIKSSIAGNPFDFSLDLLKLEDGKSFADAKVDINSIPGYANLSLEQQVKKLFNKIALIELMDLENGNRLREDTIILCSVDACNITSIVTEEKVDSGYSSPISAEVVNKYQITVSVIFLDSGKIVIGLPENG